MNLLEVKNICKTYGSGETAVRALKDVSFSVPRGEYVAIVGESGSGKSTLLNMIGALDTPTSGKVMIDGRDIFIAVILFLIVLLAGVLMISGSLNSNIANRTQFFGMMRCIGASRQQIIRFVRIEAVNWCKTAIPVGILMGTIVSWGICGTLRYGIGDEFATTPMFKISPVGVISGAVVGIVTVLWAAQSPATRASKVSPMSAVSGNMENTSAVRHAARTDFGKIDCALGIHHAAASKKNWFLLTASFTLCIILFLSFSVLMDMGDCCCHL